MRRSATAPAAGHAFCFYLLMPRRRAAPPIPAAARLAGDHHEHIEAARHGRSGESRSRAMFGHEQEVSGHPGRERTAGARPAGVIRPRPRPRAHARPHSAQGRQRTVWRALDRCRHCERPGRERVDHCAGAAAVRQGAVGCRPQPAPAPAGVSAQAGRGAGGPSDRPSLQQSARRIWALEPAAAGGSDGRARGGGCALVPDCPTGSQAQRAQALAP